MHRRQAARSSAQIPPACTLRETRKTAGMEGHRLSDELLHGLVGRLEQLKRLSKQPESVQDSIDEVMPRLASCLHPR